MSQLDWVGGTPPPAAFKDIRNTRGSVAQEAELLLTLGDLINTIPPHIKVGGSVNDVREWRYARASAAKIAGNIRSSVARNHLGDQQHAAGA